VEYFKYLGSLITNDARCTLEVKARIVLAKSAFNIQQEEAVFTSQLELHLGIN
jgi:hypothetical protein